MRILRILKGIAASAVMWAVAWVPLTIGLAGVAAAFGAPMPPANVWGMLVLRQAIAGALNGALFGFALAVLGRRRTFESLHYGLFALCGAIGGAGFPLLVTGVLLTVPNALPLQAMIFGVAMSSFLGTVCAVESLRLARRAPALAPSESDQHARIVSDTA